MTDYTQSFILSNDHITTMANYLAFEDFLALKTLSKSHNQFLSNDKILQLSHNYCDIIGENLSVSSTTTHFKEILKKIHDRQKKEYEFLYKKAPAKQFIIKEINNGSIETLSHINRLLSVKNTDSSYFDALIIINSLLSAYNSSVIRLAVLAQPGKTLKLAGITRFVVPNECIQYFSELEHLYFSGWRQNYLVTLNIHNLNALKTLSCAYNNLIRFTVQKLPKLIDIDCSNNKINTLQLQSLSELQKINCFYNPLTTLNLQGLSKVQALVMPMRNELGQLDTIMDLNIQGASQIVQDKLSSVAARVLFQKREQLLFLQFRQANDIEKKEIILDLGERYSLENCLKYNCFHYPTLLSRHPNLNDIFCEQNIHVLYGILSKMDKTLPKKLEPDEPFKILKFEQAILKIFSRQIEELKFLKQTHTDSFFLEIPELQYLAKLHLKHLVEVDKYIHDFNASIIYTSTENQPGEYLELSYITRFVISEKSKDYFAKLKILKFSRDLNCLISLTIQDLPELWHLDCRDNKLQFLNIDNCVNLQNIECENNQLTILNLSGFYNLINLSCSSNPLVSLSLHECYNLYAVFCDIDTLNGLTDLNLKGTPEKIQQQLGSIEDKLPFSKSAQEDQNFEQRVNCYLPFACATTTAPITLDMLLNSFEERINNLKLGNASQESDMEIELEKPNKPKLG